MALRPIRKTFISPCANTVTGSLANQWKVWQIDFELLKSFAKFAMHFLYPRPKHDYSEANASHSSCRVWWVICFETCRYTRTISWTETGNLVNNVALIHFMYYIS